MIVLGVGMDLVNAATFAEQLADAASGFATATFTAHELRAVAADPPELRAQRLGARFAAKEALIKAWSSARAGSPPAAADVDMRHIEVTDDGYGRPRLRTGGDVATSLAQLAAHHGHERALLEVSLTHDWPMAGAIVVLGIPHTPPA